VHNEGVNIGQLVVSGSDMKYRIIQPIGSGGNCDVYLVVSLSAKHRAALFALKLFMRTQNSERLQQFRAEVEFLNSVEHPALMRVYDKGDTSIPTKAGKSSHPFVVTDYYPETLDRALARGLRIPDRVLYMIQLLAALQYLATLKPPVVHRDIKPGNIFLRGHTCALGDFGLMRRLDGRTEEDVAGVLEKLSAGPGMPRSYRTPDLVRYANGDGPLTVASDVFQLGLVAAEIFCGRNPLKAAARKTDPIELEDLRSVPGRHGDTIKSLIQRMLVDDAAARESVEELLDPWEGVLNDVSRDYQHLEGRAF
jgi:serine/threonine protein kinase